MEIEQKSQQKNQSQDQVIDLVELCQEVSDLVPETRQKLLKKVKSYLSYKQIGYQEYRIVWRALYNALWMSDKMVNQIPLADEIAQILIFFANQKNYHHTQQWLKAGLNILRKQWPSIDYHRMNKFLKLGRFIIRYYLKAWKLKKFDFQFIIQLNQVIVEELFYGDAVGLTQHFLQIYLELVDEIQQDLDQTKVQILFKMFIDCLADSKEKNQLLFESIINNIFNRCTEMRQEGKLLVLNFIEVKNYTIERAKEQNIDNSNREILYNVAEIFADIEIAGELGLQNKKENDKQTNKVEQDNKQVSQTQNERKNSEAISESSNDGQINKTKKKKKNQRQRRREKQLKEQEKESSQGQDQKKDLVQNQILNGDEQKLLKKQKLGEKTPSSDKDYNKILNQDLNPEIKSKTLKNEMDELSEIRKISQKKVEVVLTKKQQKQEDKEQQKSKQIQVKQNEQPKQSDLNENESEEDWEDEDEEDEDNHIHFKTHYPDRNNILEKMKETEEDEDDEDENDEDFEDIEEEQNEEDEMDENDEEDDDEDYDDEEFIKEYMMNNMQKMGNNSKNKSIYDGIPIHLFMGPKQKKEYFQKLNKDYLQKINKENILKENKSNKVHFELQNNKTKFFDLNEIIDPEGKPINLMDPKKVKGIIKRNQVLLQKKQKVTIKK